MQLKKLNFYSHKSPIFLGDLDTDNVLVSNEISFGGRNYKYFICYLHDDYKIKPLHIMLPKTSMIELNGCIF